jgi:hypothetical protein
MRRLLAGVLALGLSTGAVLVVGGGAPAAADSPPVAPDVYLTMGTSPIYVGGPASLVTHVTDSNSPSTPYTVNLVSPPSHDATKFSIALDNSFNYVPTSGFTGLDSFTFTVTDASGATSNVATAYLEVGFFIMTTSLPDATRGVPYSFTLQAPGGTTPELWSKVSGTGKLPPGLRLVSKTGVIMGTPRPCPKALRPCPATPFTLEIKVHDSSRPHVFLYAPFTLTLQP